ncbi:MAG: HK97 gp10 family phage protein [Clostridiaceae bacterium]
MSDVFGFDEFESKIDNMINSIDGIVNSKFGALLDETVANTQLTTPVQSGNLRRSWGRSKITKEGNIYKGEVGTNIDYAEHVEYGHVTKNGGFVKGQFMLTNSVKVAEKKLPHVSDDILDEITKELKL